MFKKRYTTTEKYHNNSDAVGRYIEFLNERDRIKEQVKEDFRRINI